LEALCTKTKNDRQHSFELEFKRTSKHHPNHDSEMRCFVAGNGSYSTYFCATFLLC